MPLEINGSSPQTISFNNQKVSKVTVNGTQVWPAPQPVEGKAYFYFGSASTNTGENLGVFPDHSGLSGQSFISNYDVDGYKSVALFSIPLGVTGTFTAKPITNYQFVSWSDGVTDNPRSINFSTENAYYSALALYQVG